MTPLQIATASSVVPKSERKTMVCGRAAHPIDAQRSTAASTARTLRLRRDASRRRNLLSELAGIQRLHRLDDRRDGPVGERRVRDLLEDADADGMPAAKHEAVL